MGAISCRPGAEIYEYQPTMYHCKVMIVDEFMTSVGSTNFDNRSFRLNDEANLNVDRPRPEPCRSGRARFEKDLLRFPAGSPSTKWNPPTSVGSKIGDWFAGLVSSQL